MERNWKDIKWIFEPDGALRDIYVQDVTITDWEKLIDLLNNEYSYSYKFEDQEIRDKFCKNDIVKIFDYPTCELQSNALLIINVCGIDTYCHFFLINQLEFTIDPRDIESLSDYGKVEKFMLSLSEKLEKQVTLTFENLITLPLIKIDFKKNINRILTEKEYNEYSERTGSLAPDINCQSLPIPPEIIESVINSAMEPYLPTSKDKNLW